MKWSERTPLDQWLIVRALLLIAVFLIVAPLNVMFYTNRVPVFAVLAINIAFLYTGAKIRRKFQDRILESLNNGDEFVSGNVMKMRPRTIRQLRKLLEDDDAFGYELERFGLRKSFDS